MFRSKMETTQIHGLLIALIVVSLLVIGKLLKKFGIRRAIPENTSASSNSNSVPPALGIKYEVFLSFRGEDTRKAFTDFLFIDLTDAGIRTFRDNNDLRVGEEIGPELLNAIQESKICIPIFSKNYASSKWCLRELAHMVRCHTTGGENKIIPIFYDVEPSDVRHQSGSYRNAFRQHDKYFDKKTVQEWKEALKKVADLKGFELKKQADGLEGKLAKMVAEEVFTGLKKNYVPVPETLIGIDDHVVKMKGLLNVESNGVRIVGIHGMGGLGKTTIAKSIYNQLCETKSFECCCFLQDIRETSQQKGLVCLQNQLLSTIRKRKLPEIDNVDNGIEAIKKAVKGKKVLIVLDDDDEKCQFSKFADNCDFGSGSRIIVTTRNKEVLDRLGVTCDKISQLEVYEPELMNDDHSLQLFSKHAFDFESPSSPEDYETLSFLGAEYETLPKEVVSYAKGLPLVLVVIGSLLRGVKDKIIWKETLKKLEIIPAEEVQQKLRISYDTLDNRQKQIFLDIACLFVGEDKTDLLYMWEDCGFYPKLGINVLVHRSLIKVGDDNRIWMHDQLRDLGRLIVEEENFTNKGERSRLWRPEEALSVWESHTGTNNVVALRLDSLEYRRLEGKDFEELRNLRFLRLGYADFDGDFKHRFSNLRWLQCSKSGQFKPTNLGLKNLVVLKLSNCYNMTDEWEGWSEIKVATKLKVLDLSKCSGIKRASDFYSFESLERLILWSSPNLEEFDPLDGKLTKLRVLYLRGCRGLTRVNCSMFATLESLDLPDCESLRSLEGLEQLKSLTHMDISHCESLRSLEGLEQLKSLTHMDISHCNSLRCLEGLEQLKSLTHMDISHCENLILESLGMSIETSSDGNLTKLRVLDLSYCGSLTRVNCSTFSTLKSLDLRSCRSLRSLEGLEQLKSLTHMDIAYCANLIVIQGLDRLESLESLNMSACTSIEKLPGLSSLKKLTRISASRCSKLTEIGGFGELKSLESLWLSNCDLIEKLPDLSSAKNLTTIDASYCYKLTEIGGLGELKSLELLDLKSCKSIEKLPDLSSLENLTKINVSGVKLTEIGGLGELKSLESLELIGCESIEKLPDLSSLKNLTRIFAYQCYKLSEIGGLGELKSLESLHLKECESIEKLPDLSSLKNLREIDVSGCVKLTEIGGLGELKSLELLKLGGCKSIEKLPDLSSIKNLREINVSGCVKLTEIGGLGELKSLELLKLGGCKSIEKLPDLSSLKNVREIDVSGCVKLTEIGRLGELKSLQWLKLNGCKSIEKLPDLSSAKNLTMIDASQCYKLTEIGGLEELKSLELLMLGGCKSIEKLPDLSSLKNLREINVSGCVKLTEIGRLGESLQWLKLHGCESIKKLPDLSSLKNFKNLGHSLTLNSKTFVDA